MVISVVARHPEHRKRRGAEASGRPGCAALFHELRVEVGRLTGDARPAELLHGPRAPRSSEPTRQLWIERDLVDAPGEILREDLRRPRVARGVGVVAHQEARLPIQIGRAYV